VKSKPEGWNHHTVLLPGDYEGVMRDLFETRTVPREPALYVCLPTCSDPSLAPEGHHALYVLAPVPHLDAHIDWEREAPAFRQRCLNALRKAGWEGIEEEIVVERMWTPQDFQREYGLFRGSAFGLSCTFWQSAYFRPHNRSEDVRNLYLVGASTHPGGGVPIVLTSARLVAEAAQEDWERRRNHRPAPVLQPQTEAAGGAE
jgi:phytoene desaturase